MRNKIFNFQFSIFNSRGFTLIELLVVIAIIGILASLLVANFINVRERSKDAQRKSNLRQIQSALELHRADEGNYPSGSPGLKNCPVSGTKTNLGNAAATANPCGTIYMKKIPLDPSGVTYYNSGNYYYGTASTGYLLVACLENPNEQLSDTVIDEATLTVDYTGYSPLDPPVSCISDKYYVLTDL